jgi:DNA mismatch repair ATPase MutS
MTLNEPLVDTPLMKQYMAVKHKYPDAVLLFRVGDFYETFSEDAIKASKILGSRSMPSTPTSRSSFGPVSGWQSASSSKIRN